MQCSTGSVIPVDCHEVGEWLPSHRETLPLRSGPLPLWWAQLAQPPGSKQLIATSHLVLGSQGVEAEVGRQEVPRWAHFQPS